MGDFLSFYELFNSIKEEIMALAILEERDIEYYKKWMSVYLDIKLAQGKLDNYTIHLSVRKHLPTYGDISFIENDLQKFRTLKSFAGDYGFVVPVKGGRSGKVLRGEKKMKYK